MYKMGETNETENKNGFLDQGGVKEMGCSWLQGFILGWWKYSRIIGDDCTES